METPPPSGPPTISFTRNPNTRLPHEVVIPIRRPRVVAPADAYRVAVGIAADAPAIAQVGYRIFWMRGDGACGSLEAPAERGKHLVVGRHDQCDLVLDDEESVSLRHVLLRVSALDDGFPVLNVLDLETKQGFELSDHSKQRCVVATGPLVFRVGIHTLVALPNGVKVDPELPPPVVERADADPYVVRAQRVDLAPEMRSRRATRITLIPSSVRFGDAPIVGSESHAARYEVVVEQGDRRAAVRLTARDVEHGVLIGRNDKCVDAGLRSILTEYCSRVHALVIRETDGVFLYDTASTVGTYSRRARVRCVALTDEGTELSLAGDSGVTLRWRSVN
ncbi:MAG TPA: FHA domain-containing protein [Labilithrix sp.]